MTASALATGSTHKHSVRFYDDDDSLIVEVTAFLDEALAAEGSAIIVATPAHRAELARRLGAGNVTMLDAEETLARFMIGDKPDAALFESSVGVLLAGAPAGRPLHAFGEMVALLCHRGNYAGAIELEHIWNDAARRHTFSLFCAYPWQLFSAASNTLAFQHVCLAHSHIASADDAVGTRRDEELALLQQKERALASEAAAPQRSRGGAAPARTRTVGIPRARQRGHPQGRRGWDHPVCQPRRARDVRLPLGRVRRAQHHGFLH
jgi:hypothetical protein